MKFIYITFFVFGFSQNIFAGGQPSILVSCNTESMLPFVRQGIFQFTQRTIANSYRMDDPTNPFANEIIPPTPIPGDLSKIQITFLGKGVAQDDALMPKTEQNLANVTVPVLNTNITLSLENALEIFNGERFILNKPSKAAIAFPDPVVIETKDQFGNVVARNCVVYSYAKYNRYVVFVNTSNQFIVFHSLVSSDNPIYASVRMPLPKSTLIRSK